MRPPAPLDVVNLNCVSQYRLSHPITNPLPPPVHSSEAAFTLAILGLFFSVSSKYQPLALYTFTLNKDEKEHILNEVWCGGVTFNDSNLGRLYAALVSRLSTYPGKYSFVLMGISINIVN